MKDQAQLWINEKSERYKKLKCDEVKILLESNAHLCGQKYTQPGLGFTLRGSSPESSIWSASTLTGLTRGGTPATASAIALRTSKACSKY